MCEGVASGTCRMQEETEEVGIEVAVLDNETGELMEDAQLDERRSEGRRRKVGSGREVQQKLNDMRRRLSVER